MLHQKIKLIHKGKLVTLEANKELVIAAMSKEEKSVHMVQKSPDDGQAK